MTSGARILVLGGILLAGCEAAHDLAVKSFRVIDAPAAYVRRRIDDSRQTTTTTTRTTETVASDSVAGGRPIEVAPRTSPSPRVVSRSGKTKSTAGATPRPSRGTPTPASKKSAPGPSSRSASTQSFPRARAVPGKPGYVFSPFDPNGGYVDVTGYKPGDKVKDPYSGKVFLVP